MQVELRPITPVLIAGADPRHPEPMSEGLRVPSLRGALRFWCRAAIAPTLLRDGSVDLKRLRERETDIFGGTGQGSLIRMRSSPSQDTLLLPDDAFESDFYPRMGDSSRKKIVRRGILPAKLPNKGKQASIAPGFHLTTSFDGLDTESQDCFEAALGLFLALGGIGFRSRRGFGSLEAAPSETAPSRLFLPSASAEELKDRFQAHVASLLSVLQRPDPRHDVYWKAGARPLFSVLSPHGAQIFCVQSIRSSLSFWDSGWDAMVGLRESFYRALKRMRHAPSIGYAGRQSRLASPILIQIKRCQVPTKTRAGLTGQHGYFGVVVVFHHQNSALWSTDDIAAEINAQGSLRVSRIDLPQLSGSTNSGETMLPKGSTA